MRDGLAGVYNALLARRRERLERLFAALERAADCLDVAVIGGDSGQAVSAQPHANTAESAIATGQTRRRDHDAD